MEVRWRWTRWDGVEVMVHESVQSSQVGTDHEAAQVLAAFLCLRTTMPPTSTHTAYLYTHYSIYFVTKINHLEYQKSTRVTSK